MEEEKRTSEQLYDDELQASVRNLQKEADEAMEKAREEGIAFTDVVKDLILFVLTTALAFGWLLVMLLIVSFVSMGYLHMQLRHMLIASAVFAVIYAAVYVWKKIRKYRDLLRRK